MPESHDQPGIMARLLTLVALLWAGWFLWFFFGQTLPNLSTADAPISRSDIVTEIGNNPFSLLNPLDYSSRAGADSGWKFLPQRMPFVGTALLLWLAAWSLGRAVLQALFVRTNLLWSECFVLDMGVGITLFTLWVLACGVAGHLSTATVLTPSVVALSVVIIGWKRGVADCGALVESSLPSEAGPPNRKLAWLLTFMALPFAWHIILGGVTPPFDFDVREYHLQGPKEWFLAGRVTTLEHNVYTSFPFLSEMLSLAAMVLHGDWWQGAISGKLTLAGFQFLSAICVYAMGRRWLGVIPGLIAVVALVSTPWTIRISIIAYAEGALTFYLTATAMAALLAVQQSAWRARVPLTAVTGFLAGSAMAAKYPGVLSVVIPVGMFLLVRSQSADEGDSSRAGRLLKLSVVFGLAVCAAVGPWLLRNAVDTGNPVYPLAYSVFGAADWSPAMDAKWKAAHSAPDHNVAAIPAHIADVAARSDWQNGFLFAFAVPALMLAWRYRPIGWIALHIVWMLVTWWALTHRIDRFWIPIIPLLAILAGAAWKLSDGKLWRSALLVSLVACCVFNYGFSRLDGIGFHVGMMDMTEAKRKTVRRDMKLLNETLPPDARVLMVGEAEVFNAEFQLVYNTVFDDSIFEQWMSRTDQPDVAVGDRRMKSAAEIRDTLREHEITHVFVNWSEILRYRMTYGYTDYVTPQRFLQLEEMGILQPPIVMATGDWNGRSDAEQQEVSSWPGTESLRSGPASWTSMLLYRVTQE